MVFAIHCHKSAMGLHAFPSPIPPPASLSIPSLWVFPVHQPWALVSCIQPGLVICFTLDSILVSVLFSQNILPSPKFFTWRISFQDHLGCRQNFISCNYGTKVSVFLQALGWELLSELRGCLRPFWPSSFHHYSHQWRLPHVNVFN